MIRLCGDFQEGAERTRAFTTSSAASAVALDLVFTASASGVQWSPIYSGSFNVQNPFIAELDDLVTKINELTRDSNFYEDDEVSPSADTKALAKRLIYHASPPRLLSGADVYPYYGEINIVWENGGKKVKLIVPPRDSGRSPSLYRGQLRGDRVPEPLFDQNVSPENLRESLAWLHE
jgi:hypothetical protein